MREVVHIRLNERWRVIESDDGAPYGQWLLQRLDSGQWKSKSWCQTQQGLLTAINEKIVKADRFYKGGTAMAVEEVALDGVKNLPQRFPQRMCVLETWTYPSEGHDLNEAIVCERCGSVFHWIPSEENWLMRTYERHDTELEVTVAACRDRLRRFTRPVFEREVVEALLAEVERLKGFASERDGAGLRDLTEYEIDLQEEAKELNDELDALREQAGMRSVYNNRIGQENRELRQQVGLLYCQLRWFMDAEPVAVAARIAWLRDMSGRLLGEEP